MMILYHCCGRKRSIILGSVEEKPPRSGLVLYILKFNLDMNRPFNYFGDSVKPGKKGLLICLKSVT